MSQVKRICAGLLAIMMLMSFLTVSAFAATPAGMEVTTDGESIDKLKAGDTVTVKLTLPVMEKLAGVQIELGFDKSSFEFQEKTQYDEELGTDVKVINTGLNKWNPTITDKGNANTTGIVAFNAVGTTNRKITTEGFNLLTIEFKVLDGASGSAQFSVNLFNLGYIDSEHSAQPITDVTAPSSTTVTITKAPIASVTASVEKPEAGKKLDFNGTVDAGAPYSITKVEWFEGTGATTGTPVTAPAAAKANQDYYARITLTANPGETFAASLRDGDATTNGYSITRDGDEKLLLTCNYQTQSFPPATVTAAPTAYPDRKYNGSEQFLLSYRGTADGGTMQYSLNGTDWSDTDPKGTDAKTYIVYYKAKGDSTHSDSAVASISAKIEPKEISGVTIASIADQSYTGSAITPDLEVKDGTATLTQGKDYTVSYANNTDAGTATLTITGKGNYTGTNSKNFTIDPATQTISGPGSVDVAYDTTLDLNTVYSSNVHGATLTFARPSTSSMPTGTTFNESTGTVTAGNNTGAFTVTVNSDAVTNYAAAPTVTITVRIVEKTPSVYTTEVKAKTDLKYDGSEQALVTAGVANGGTVKYSLDSTNWTDTVPTGKDAKTYTVYYNI